MKIPSTFRYKGKTWKVEYEDNLSHDGVDCDGLCRTDIRTIYLDKSLKGKKKKEIFFHELFHAVVFEAHIVNSFTEEIEDILAEAVADLMTNYFKDMEWKK